MNREDAKSAKNAKGEEEKSEADQFIFSFFFAIFASFAGCPLGSMRFLWFVIQPYACRAEYSAYYVRNSGRGRAFG